MIGNKSEKGNQIGTYGMIKNPQGFIVGSCENDNEALVDFGCCFEGRTRRGPKHGGGPELRHAGRSARLAVLRAYRTAWLAS